MNVNPFPCGWVYSGNVVLAPCGCKAVVTGFTPCPRGVYMPSDGTLHLEDFQYCGNPSNLCRFQKKGRSNSFRNDIPTDRQVWFWMQLFHQPIGEHRSKGL